MTNKFKKGDRVRINNVDIADSGIVEVGGTGTVLTFEKEDGWYRVELDGVWLDNRPRIHVLYERQLEIVGSVKRKDIVAFLEKVGDAVDVYELVTGNLYGAFEQVTNIK